jgi:hypothetical protein
MTKEWKEAVVTVNGKTLTVGESMTLRVALASFDCDCGDDEHGLFMTKAYGEAQARILGYMSEGLKWSSSTPSGGADAKS